MVSCPEEGCVIVREGFTYRSGVRIEFVVWSPAGRGEVHPIIFLPGFMSSAWGAESTAEQLATVKAGGPRILVVGVSLRGRGRSAFSPAVGCSIEHHVRDIEAVRSELGLTQPVICAFSTSVIYAIAYALKHSATTKGLILGDYPPRLPQIKDAWVTDMEGVPWSFPNWAEAESWAVRTGSISLQDIQRARGRWFVESPSGEVLRLGSPSLPRQLQAESAPVDFSQRLKEIRCPVMVLKGTLAGSLLNDSDVALYEKECNAKVIRPPTSHDVFSHPSAVPAIRDFLEAKKSEWKLQI